MDYKYYFFPDASEIIAAYGQLTVQRIIKNSKGIRVNKKQYCVFCEKLYHNMARHLELAHNNEIEVAKILTLP